MSAKNPRAGQGAGALVSIAADVEVSKAKTPLVQPYSHRFKVAITPGIWRGFTVSTEPPSWNHPLQSFVDHAAALAFAEKLSALEAWPILDRTEARL